MISMIEDKMPHVELFTHGELSKHNIAMAYRELSTSYHGVSDFVVILDEIFEGAYSISEVTIAGAILDKGLDGYYMHNGGFEKAKYLRVNGSDMIYLILKSEIITNQDFSRSEFDGNNGVRYKLTKRRFKKNRSLEHDNNGSKE